MAFEDPKSEGNRSFGANELCVPLTLNCRLTPEATWISCKGQAIFVLRASEGGQKENFAMVRIAAVLTACIFLMSCQSRPVTTFQDCADCPEMVVMPVEKFAMGDLDNLGSSTELPVHEVRFDYLFAVGRFEVTFRQWDACVADGGCGSYRPSDLDWGKGTRPVINVSWDDAQAYTAWLSRKTGAHYRLLSEAEWEFAARAGTATQYSWGNSIGSGNANCNGCGSDWDSERTARVGSFSPNPFGLYDMAGNVWEWTEDCRMPLRFVGYVGAPNDGSPWTAGGACGMRMIRGGSWKSRPSTLRSSHRDWEYASERANSQLGMRVARTLEHL